MIYSFFILFLPAVNLVSQMAGTLQMDRNDNTGGHAFEEEVNIKNKSIYFKSLR
jgi:hypothetical protein